jgi:hypothetical protein
LAAASMYAIPFGLAGHGEAGAVVRDVFAHGSASRAAGWSHSRPSSFALAGGGAHGTSASRIVEDLHRRTVYNGAGVAPTIPEPGHMAVHTVRVGPPGRTRTAHRRAAASTESHWDGVERLRRPSAAPSYVPSAARVSRALAAASVKLHSLQEQDFGRPTNVEIHSFASIAGHRVATSW